MTPTPRYYTNNTIVKHTSKVAAIPMATLYFSSRCVTALMGITTCNLVETTKQLVEAIQLDGVVFLDLTLGDATTSQLVTPQVICPFLSQEACQSR